jgi:hypothetical protein
MSRGRLQFRRAKERSMNKLFAVFSVVALTAATLAGSIAARANPVNPPQVAAPLPTIVDEGTGPHTITFTLTNPNDTDLQFGGAITTPNSPIFAGGADMSDAPRDLAIADGSCFANFPTSGAIVAANGTCGITVTFTTDARENDDDFGLWRYGIVTWFFVEPLNTSQPTFALIRVDDVPASIPEPGTLFLLALGTLGAGIVFRTKR